jgi:hypothetical protein
MIVKTFNEFVNEAYGSGYGLHMTAVKHGKKIREERIFPTIDNAREFMINWLSKHTGYTIEYFDICSGSNYSDPDCLEIWGGYGGYFANIVNGGYKYNQQFSRREIEDIERSEVDINTYLKIK